MICLERGFGWESWGRFLRILFPPEKFIPGYDVLPVAYSLRTRLLWPYYKAKRLAWLMKGPL